MLTKLIYFIYSPLFSSSIGTWHGFPGNPVGPFYTKDLFSPHWRADGELCADEKLLMNVVADLSLLSIKTGYARTSIVPTMKEFTAVLLFFPF